MPSAPCPQCDQTGQGCSIEANGWVWCSHPTTIAGFARIGSGSGPGFYRPDARSAPSEASRAFLSIPPSVRSS
jgi:hypothetical protein